MDRPGVGAGTVRLRHGLLEQVPPCGRPLATMADAGRGRGLSIASKCKPSDD
jgi:hypothetical protein